MKLIPSLVLFGALSTMAVSAMAEETWSEKAGAKGNDVKRELKKAGNRIEEGACMEGDIKCGARKAGNRVEEAKDATVDGAKKVKSKVD